MWIRSMPMNDHSMVEAYEQLQFVPVFISTVGHGGGALHRVHSPQLMYRFFIYHPVHINAFFVFCCSLLVRNGFISVYSRCLLVRVLVKSRAENCFLDEEIGTHRCFVGFLALTIYFSALLWPRSRERKSARVHPSVLSEERGKSCLTLSRPGVEPTLTAGT